MNLVVSRKSGGAVRAPGNAGDKRVKTKRGNRSAAVAARIERGYLKRTRTAGGTACVNNHVDSRGTGTDGGSHRAAERTSTTARDGGDDTHNQKRKPRTASAELDITRHPLGQVCFQGTDPRACIAALSGLSRDERARIHRAARDYWQALLEQQESTLARQSRTASRTHDVSHGTVDVGSGRDLAFRGSDSHTFHF